MNDDALDVLLIEDNPQEAEIVRLYLAKRRAHQYHVRHAATIAAGLSQLAENVPDVILLDLHLPDTEGLDGFERLMAVRSDVPIVILTNYDAEDMAAMAVRAGAQEYLVKREVNAALLHRAIMYAIERHMAELAVHKERERYELATAGANDCIWDWERKTGQAFFSRRWNELVGLDPEMAIDRLDSWLNRVHPKDIGNLKASLTAPAGQEQNHFDCEHRIRRENGDYIWVYARGIVIADAHGRVVRMAGSISGIGQRKETEHELIRRALHDSLTGLPNRVLFVERLQQALRRYRRDSTLRFAVLYFDLDGFKLVNDSLGHSAGDSLLVSIARRLNNVIRPGDTVARMGGDEFAVLVADMVSPADVALVADRVHEVFLAEFQVAGRGMFSSASIGVATVSEQYETPEEVLRDADLAMYQAKRSPAENTVVFDASMHQEAISRLNLETDLHHALSRGEFVLYYQPIVNIADRKIVAFEALLRWVHPEKGLLEASTFFKTLQDTGMLSALSWWVLEQACRQAKVWNNEFVNGSRIRLSVNVSANMFRLPDAVARVMRLVEDNDLRPGDLSLELTELDYLENEEDAQSALKALSASGVLFYADDFGTGYSSLSCLQRCPYDTVKIDRSLVEGIERGSECLTIIKTIVGLGRMLNMNVVAEGVESQSQLDALSSLGCPEAQGFWFSRPVPGSEVPALVSQGQFERPRRYDS